MRVNVYSQYLAANCDFAGVQRRGALVVLISDSEAGNITYTVQVTFFPHCNEEDFSVTYDACASRGVYSAKGRRSKKREADLLQTLRTVADELATELHGQIFWEKPLCAARMG